MSDRLTLKETGAILKFAFKTANKKVYILAGSVGVLIGLILGGMSLAGNATQADLNGEKVTHANCTVTDKHAKMFFNGRTTMISGYAVDTSCGTYNADSNFYESLNKGETYNLLTSVGNWANQPTVVSATVSAK